MNMEHAGFIFSRDKEKLSLERVCALLGQSYWANSRSKERVVQSIANSLCYGIYQGGYQVGFARVVTDAATFYWLCDVIIDETYRGQGLGKKLVEYVLATDELKGLHGALRTKNAHGLYARYGFAHDADSFMVKRWS